MKIFDPKATYTAADDRGVLSYIDLIRQGIQYKTFLTFANNSPFSINEWSLFLHLSERTLQRYEKEKRKFDPLQSEKILEIVLLYKLGISVFGDAHRFHTWLNTQNLALGNITPKSLFDSSFGINLLKDELFRIESGTLA